jgi:ParB family chromosome partitioning protein
MKKAYRAQAAEDARRGNGERPDTVALEKRVSDVLGLKVSVDHRDPGGTVQIKYKDLDQLDEILRRLEAGKKTSSAAAHSRQ